MAARLIRKTAILAKNEPTYGEDAIPTGAANAILVSNCTIDLGLDQVDRDLYRPYLGASEQLAAARRMSIGFDVEIAGSGTAGTAPKWGALLKACSFAETVLALTNVIYNPISSGFDSATIYYYLDGILYKALGCRGDVAFKMGVGERPVMSFSFTGLDGGEAAAALPTQTLTAWKTPYAVTKQTAVTVATDVTYAAGVWSGGNQYPSQGLNINIANGVNHAPLLGEESVDITKREITGSFTRHLEVAQEITMRENVRNNSLTSLGFTIANDSGTPTAGKIVSFYAPAVQRANPKNVNYNGRLLISNDLRFLPDTGNDELLVIVR